MKQKKFSGRLVLNKRTITNLKHQDMGKIYVGIDDDTRSSILNPVCPITCLDSCPCGNTQ